MNKTELSRFLLSASLTIKDAMQSLNQTAKKVVYVVDANGALVGAVTDGDIRRGILNNVDLQRPVTAIMNSKPKFVNVDQAGVDSIKSIMLTYLIESLPVLDGNRAIVDIVSWSDVFKGAEKKKHDKKEATVFILAGGVGARLEPFTKILPKPLVPIGDTPILERIMDRFASYGFGKFIISLNYRSEMIRAYFSEPGVQGKYDKIQFLKEDFMMGTIGSLSLAEKMVSDDFFVSNCDIVIEENLEDVYRHHVKNKNMLTIIGCVKQTVLPYGVLKIDDKGMLEKIQEKPEYHHVINTGIYVANKGVFKYLSRKKKEDMPELIQDLLKGGHRVGVYPVLDHQWFDVGQWVEFEKTKKFFEK